MDREEAFEFLDRTARGIAEMFGSTCETLVHDMGDPRHPILSIYNGHVSGRTVGSTMDILGTAKELDQDALVTDFVNLYATTPSGQQIKSSTFHLIGEDFNLALGINFDYSSLVYANRILVDLMSAEADLQSAMWHGGEGQLTQIFEECLAAVGKPVNVLTKRGKTPSPSASRCPLWPSGSRCPGTRCTNTWESSPEPPVRRSNQRRIKTYVSG